MITLACRVSGHSRHAFDRQLQANERLSPEAIHRMQWQKLQALLEHAYATVPYYRDLFEREKITPRDIGSWRDYAALPMLTKALIRERGIEAFRSAAFPRSRLEETTTSGSTGAPLRFLREPEYEEWRMAGSWRGWRWGNWRPGDKIAWVWREYWSPDSRTRLAKRINWWITRRRLYNVLEMSCASMDAWFDDLRRFKPRFVHGYPSALTRLAGHLAEKRVEINGIHAVFTNGEMLHDHQRTLIQHAFQTKVHNVYGSAEVHPIAAECRLGALHLSTDLIVPELENGGQGSDLRQVVLTPLHAYGMPLLRYEVGDLAQTIANNCSCGLPFPVLNGLVGRAADLFPLSHGRVVHGQILLAYMSGLPDIDRFQFRQTSQDRLHLYVVKGPGFGFQSARELDRIGKTMTGELNIPVQIEFVDQIPLTGAGKFRSTVCEVKT